MSRVASVALYVSETSAGTITVMPGKLPIRARSSIAWCVMKLITAILQPAKLDDVKAALAAANFKGLTIAEVKGHGAQKGRTEYYRGAEIHVEFLTKVRVDLIVADEDLDAAMGTIVEAARTGNIGDGKVWATDVTHLVRVRTGETGPAAL